MLYLTAALGSVPWIALALPATFGLYGLVKKAAPLGAVQGLTAETGLLLLPAAAVLVWGPDGTPPGVMTGGSEQLLLAGSGVVTVVPLVLFAASVRLGGADQKVDLNVIEKRTRDSKCPNALPA